MLPVDRNTSNTYKWVVDDVISKCKPQFIQEGVDESILAQLRTTWEAKLMQAGLVIDPSAPPPAPPVPQHAAPMTQQFASYSGHAMPQAAVPGTMNWQLQRMAQQQQALLAHAQVKPELGGPALGAGQAPGTAANVQAQFMAMYQQQQVFQAQQAQVQQQQQAALRYAQAAMANANMQAAAAAAGLGGGGAGQQYAQGPSSTAALAASLDDASRKRKFPDGAQVQQRAPGGPHIPQHDGPGDNDISTSSHAPGGASGASHAGRSALLAAYQRSRSQVDSTVGTSRLALAAGGGRTQHKGIPQHDGPADAGAEGGEGDADAEGGEGEGDEEGGGADEETAAAEPNDEVLSSDSEPDEEQGDEDVDNFLCGQFEKVQRTKAKWKLVMKDGVFHAEGRDYLFKRATGELTWR